MYKIRRLRNTLLKNISEKLETDGDIIVLLGDLGTFQMRKAIERFPKRVINFGIMEQSMIGFSAGISKGGFYPITYSITPFLVDRAFEQIKIDLIYNKNNSLILSAGGSFDYSNLGPTHHCPHDVSNLLAINHPLIVHPFTSLQAIKLSDFIISNKKQAYLRISTSQLDLESLQFKKNMSPTFNLNKGEVHMYEKYDSFSKIGENKLSILFGPDSKYLKDFEHIVNESSTIFTITAITKKSLSDLSLEINKYQEVYLFIPYEPSSLILRLLKFIKTANSVPSKMIAIHPTNRFFDNSYQKEFILKNFSEQSKII